MKAGGGLPTIEGVAPTAAGQQGCPSVPKAPPHTSTVPRKDWLGCGQGSQAVVAAAAGGSTPGGAALHGPCAQFPLPWPQPCAAPLHQAAPRRRLRWHCGHTSSAPKAAGPPGHCGESPIPHSLPHTFRQETATQLSRPAKAPPMGASAAPTSSSPVLLCFLLLHARGGCLFVLCRPLLLLWQAGRPPAALPEASLLQQGHVSLGERGGRPLLLLHQSEMITLYPAVMHPLCCSSPPGSLQELKG